MRFEFHGCFNVLLCHKLYTDGPRIPSVAAKNIVLTCSIGKTEKGTNASFSLWDVRRWTSTFG
jgi:hypothetical protein